MICPHCDSKNIRDARGGGARADAHDDTMFVCMNCKHTARWIEFERAGAYALYYQSLRRAESAESALRAILDNHDKLTAAGCADIARGVLGGDTCTK